MPAARRSIQPFQQARYTLLPAAFTKLHSEEVRGDVRSHRARPMHYPFAAPPPARCTINRAARSRPPTERARDPPSVACSGLFLLILIRFSPQQLVLILIRWLIRLFAYSISVGDRPAQIPRPILSPAGVGERSRVRAIQPAGPARPHSPELDPLALSPYNTCCPYPGAGCAAEETPCSGNMDCLASPF